MDNNHILESAAPKTGLSSNPLFRGAQPLRWASAGIAQPRSRPGTEPIWFVLPDPLAGGIRAKRIGERQSRKIQSREGLRCVGKLK